VRPHGSGRSNDGGFRPRTNWSSTRTPALSYDGVGYGDSYIIDPFGEMLVRTPPCARISSSRQSPPVVNDKGWGVGRTLWIPPEAREFGKHADGYAADQRRMCE